MKFQKINALIRIIFLTSLMMIVSSAAASAPSGPISSVYEFSGSDTWTSDIVFAENGQLIVSGDLEISGAKISYADSWNSSYYVPAITVKEGASLTLSSGCLYDLSATTKTKHRAITVEPGGKLILDHAEISGGKATGFSESGEDNSFIFVDEGELIIQNSLIKNNNGIYVIEIKNGVLKMSDSTVSNNEIIDFLISDSSESYISNSSFVNNITDESVIIIGEGFAEIQGNTLFEQNSGSIGNMMIGNGELVIGDGPHFINNYFVQAAILAISSDISIGKAVFSGNSGSVSGAIRQGCGKLTLNGTEFLDNKGGVSGAIFADTYYDGSNKGEENAMVLDITDVVFDSNSSRMLSSGIVLSDYNNYDPGWKNKRNSIKAVIHSALFKNNKVEQGSPYPRFKSTSALYIGYDATVYIEDLAVVGNDSVGIRSGFNSETFIYPRNGAVIFNNSNPYAVDGYADLLQQTADTPPEGEENALTMISEKMFNGGNFRWHYTEDGQNAGADPTNTDYSAAKVLIQNNGFAAGSIDVITSAITNHGKLYIGQEAVSIPLEVQWIYPEDQAQEPPAPLAYLPSLILETAGQVYPFGELTEEQHTTAEDGTDNYIFRSSVDIYLEIHVTDHHDGHWSITFIDLPKYQDGSELVFGLKSAAFPNYVTSIGGDMTDGFVVVNTFREQQDPSGDLVFSRLENMETLPRTGFPSNSSGTER